MISHDHPHRHLVQAICLHLNVATQTCRLPLEVYGLQGGLSARSDVAREVGLQLYAHRSLMHDEVLVLKKGVRDSRVYGHAVLIVFPLRS